MNLSFSDTTLRCLSFTASGIGRRRMSSCRRSSLSRRAASASFPSVTSARTPATLRAVPSSFRSTAVARLLTHFHFPSPAGRRYAQSYRSRLPRTRAAAAAVTRGASSGWIAPIQLAFGYSLSSPDPNAPTISRHRRFTVVVVFPTTQSQAPSWLPSSTTASRAAPSRSAWRCSRASAAASASRRRERWRRSTMTAMRTALPMKMASSTRSLELETVSEPWGSIWMKASCEGPEGRRDEGGSDASEERGDDHRDEEEVGLRLGDVAEGAFADCDRDHDQERRREIRQDLSTPTGHSASHSHRVRTRTQGSPMGASPDGMGPRKPEPRSGPERRASP